MKNFTLSILTAMALVTATGLSALAETSGFSGNQLMKGGSHWYEKAATSVGPADKAAKGELVLQTGSSLYLEGDSTLHKYQMNANSLLGSAQLKDPKMGLEKALEAGAVDSMTLVVPVADLRSREKGLDENADKALLAKDNPNITFTLDSLSLKDGKMTAKGSLSIAGTAKAVTLSPTAEVKDGTVRIKGIQKVKMSDHKVTPPSVSLLVTSITCSDEVEVHYDVTFAVK